MNMEKIKRKLVTLLFVLLFSTFKANVHLFLVSLPSSYKPHRRNSLNLQSIFYGFLNIFFLTVIYLMNEVSLISMFIYLISKKFIIFK